MPTATSTVGQRIREARRRAGLSQERLALALGTTRQVVIRWEKNRHLPNASSRLKLAEATGQEPALFIDVHARAFDSDEETEMRERAKELLAPFQRVDGGRTPSGVPSPRRGKEG